MNKRYFKSALYTAALFCSMAFVACESDDITVGQQVDNGYENIYANGVQLSDAVSGKQAKILELWGTATTVDVKVSLTQVSAEPQTLTVKNDAAFLAAYNEKHGTEFELLHDKHISFENGGVVTVPAGQKETTIAMTVSAAANVDLSKNYVILVGAAGEGISTYPEDSHCIYIVSDQREAKTCDKGEGAVKGFLFFEVNDVNPLNALSFELENGKLVWDAVVLFAANINYDSENERAYIKCNPQTQFLLDNNETYLQPLRKRGIKVILGLLGNHDIAGLAQLSDIGAKDFAAEIAYYCEAYNLDGVNFDDEYSKSPDLTNPYFTSPSSRAAARLCYETKLAMPDKLVTVFAYGQMYGEDECDGVDADEWIDVAVANYGGKAYPVGSMGYEKCSGISMEFWQGWPTFYASTAQQILSGGYGWIMGFAPNPSVYNRVYNQMQDGCETLWGSKLKPLTLFYKQFDPNPYVYPDDL